MVKTLLPFTFSVVCLVMYSCDKDRIRNKEFTLWGEYEHSNEIKLRGLFYNEKPFLEDGTLDYYLFYENGIVYRNYYVQKSDKLPSDLVQEGLFKEEYRDIYYSWGAFDIEHSEITIQVPTTTRFGELPIQDNRGILLNDSTFILYLLKDKDLRASHELVFRYKKLNVKPDSNCVLIEDLGPPCCPND